jgi:hypothetical protein
MADARTKKGEASFIGENGEDKIPNARDRRLSGDCSWSTQTLTQKDDIKAELTTECHQRRTRFLAKSVNDACWFGVDLMAQIFGVLRVRLCV